MVLWMVLVLLLGMVMVFGCTQSLVGLGVSGLLVTVMVSLLMGLMFSYWVGMAVFLIYVGGLMVVFCYFIVIVPNQRFRAKLSGWGVGMGFLYLGALYSSSEELVNFCLGSMPMEVSGLYSFVNFPILVVLGIVLLLTLVGVVEVVELGYGPLRPFVFELAHFY